MGCATGKDLSGWFELDRHGTVLYCRPVNGDGLGFSEPQFVGKDFFGDLMVGSVAEPLRRHFKSFVTSERPVENFVVDCIYDDETVTTKVCMTRGHESDSNHTEGIIILDIRKESNI